MLISFLRNGAPDAQKLKLLRAFALGSLMESCVICKQAFDGFYFLDAVLSSIALRAISLTGVRPMLTHEIVRLT